MIAAPVIVPLICAVVVLAVRRWPRVARALSVTGHGLHVAAAVAVLLATMDGLQVARIGDWPAPFGIALVADVLAGLLVSVAAIVGGAVGVYCARSPGAASRSPLTHFLLAGVSGAFLTGDLFNLFVWFEVLLVASFVLMALDGGRAALAGALRYVAINLVSSALFLTALGLLYAKAGTLDMAAVASLAAADDGGALDGVAALLMVAFGIKAGLFPLFGWLPPSYPAAAPVVSALFAGLLTKVGVYALVRVFTLIFAHDGAMHDVLLVLGVLTMAVGVLGAASRGGLRRILSFHIISQIGYIVTGLALFTPLAVGAAIFYLVHHIVVKTALFLVGGLMGEAQGTEELKEMGGLRTAWPALALAFAIPAMSLAGVPPFSGFFAKLGIIRAGFDADAPAVAIVALAVGLLTIYSMVKIAHAALLRPAGEHPPTRLGRGRLWPIAGLAALSIAIGLGAGPLFELCLEAGAELLDRTAYLEAAS